MSKDRYHSGVSLKRGVAQPGSALALGARCRRFKSSHPDFFIGCLYNPHRNIMFCRFLPAWAGEN